MKIYKFDKFVKEAMGDKYENEFDKILNSRPEEKYYKTSVKNYSDSDYLRIIWRMPLEKLQKLIELLEKDRKTSIELGRPKSIIKQLYKKDKMSFDSKLKWANETLKRRTKNEPMPEWLLDKNPKENETEVNYVLGKIDELMDQRLEDNDTVIKWYCKGFHADSIMIYLDKARNTFFVEWSSEYGDVEDEEFQFSEASSLLKWVAERI